MSTQRRYDPLTGNWLTVSTGRLDRPWQGQRGLADQRASAAPSVAHEPGCYLCAGNTRSSGAINPLYTGTFVFDNDFPALAAHSAPQPEEVHSLFRAMPVTGTCRVLCYTPHHDGHLGTLSLAQLEAVIALWQAQWLELSQRYAWVQIFENRGAEMGASSPHPHGQIWATSYLPQGPMTETFRQQAYHTEHGRTLLGDYLTEELRRGDRLVTANDHWAVVVPYWAVWPFETLLLPRAPRRCMGDIEPQARAALAVTLKDLIGRYDRLFDTPFPYSMGWHGSAGEHWTLHAHFLPPLLRSATVRKHMVGFELLAEAQRDLSPEEAAARLRAS